MSDYKKILIPPRIAIREAIAVIDAGAMQIALVVDENNILLGTVTDGDIRRGLLRGLDLDSSIDSIMHREAMVAPPQMGRDMVLHLMQANVISALPIVDENRRLVGLHLLNKLLAPTPRNNIMIIMAGGQGIRLRPHTENCPKPMLPVCGKPMLEHIIERAKAEGFERFIVALHYLGHMIQDYFEDGGKWKVQIEYLHENFPLGTAGALSLMDSKPDEPFLVTNGDVLTDVKYGELLDFHCHHSAAATMAVRMHEWQQQFGVVRTKGVDITGFEEKPIIRSHINAGIYVLEPRSLDVFKGHEYCDMPTLFGRLQDRGERTIAFPMHEPWLDVGRISDYEEAQEIMQSRSS